MIQFLTDHVDLVNTALNLTMVVIWIAYLQIFLVSHLRQSRSVIHIDLGLADGSLSRCLVTNLSSGAIYVQGIAADLGRDGQSSRMVITEREEIKTQDVVDPMERTNRGTLQPGQTVDIGSLDDMIRRAQIRLGEAWSFDEIEKVTLIVVGISGQADRIVGASKEFSVQHEEKRVMFYAENILTHQIHPRQTRKTFNDLLRERTFQ